MTSDLRSLTTSSPLARSSGGPSGSEPARKPRVIIADDHRLMVAGLVQLLGSECVIVATANDGEGLLADVQRHHPDIVVLDMSMPPFNGVDLIRRIRRTETSARIVVVTLLSDADVAAEALHAGASAYVLKDCAPSELLEAVRHAMDGQTYVTPLIAGDVLSLLMKSGERRPSEMPLTTRQREVLRLLAEGKSMKEVAATLNLATRTVAFHKYQIMRQLQIKTSAELVRFAVARKIV
jgi:DNA-binding NarL/FixJ family response regulator